MTACVIMHNMIVQDESPDEIYNLGLKFQDDNIVSEHGGAATFAQFIEFHHQMCDCETHIQLQDDLVEHMWAHVGN